MGGESGSGEAEEHMEENPILTTVWGMLLKYLGCVD